MAFQFMLKKKGKPEAYIYLRYSYKDFQDVLFSTGKKIHIDQWNDAKGCPKPGYKGGTVSLGRYLNLLEGAIQKVVTDMENEGLEPVPDRVKERYEESSGGVFRGSIKLVTLWQKFIELNSKGKSEGTVRNEMNSLRTFTEFTTYIQKQSLTPRSLTNEILADYEDYLNHHAITFRLFLETNTDQGKGLIDRYYKWLEARPVSPSDKTKQGNKAKKLKHFKRFLRSIHHPVTEQVKYSDTAGHKLSFTETEMSLIENHDFSADQRLRRIQDLALIQANTGLRISDRKRLGMQHQTDNAIIIKAYKTGSDMKLPVTETIRKVFARNGYKLPELSDQKFNEGFKDLVKIVLPEAKVEIVEHRANQKIFRTVYKWEIASSHSLVRTFINIRAKRGMPVPAIAAVTGKTVEVLLKNYLDYDKEQAFEDAKKYSG